MTRARELANFADNTAGLETLTVSDITDLSVSASNINSATNQITDSSTDLNVDSNTLVVDKSANRVGIGIQPSALFHISGTSNPTVAISETASITSGSRGDISVYNNALSTVGLLRFGAETDNVGTHLAIYTRPASGSLVERMRIDSSGDVGIGTDNPAQILHLNDVSGSTAPAIKFTNNANSRGLEIRATFSGDYHSFKSIGTSGGFDFGTDQSGGTSYMRIDNSGNVGIGVTPENWDSSGYVNLQIGSSASFRADTDTNNNFVAFLLNRYKDASDNTWKRINTGHSTEIAQTVGNGTIDFYISSTSGSADSAITDHDLRMRIDSSGNVGIGTSSPSGYGLSLERSGVSSSEIDISLTSGTSNKECIINFGSNLTNTDRYKGRIFYQTDNNVMGFWTNKTERMRIQSDGDVVPASSTQDLGEGANKWANIHISRGTNFGTHNGKAYCWRLSQSTMVIGSGSRQYDILQPGQGYSAYQGWGASGMVLYDEYGNAGGNITNPSSSDWITFANNRIALNANGEHGSLYHFYGYVNWYTYAWTANGYITVIDNAGNDIYSFEGGTDTNHSGYRGDFSFLVDFDSMVNIRFYNNYRRGTYSSISGGHLNIRRIN